MQFKYKALGAAGSKTDGTIDSINIDVAITSLQKKGLVIVAISPVIEEKSWMNIEFSFLPKVSNKDVVILSRQMATLFDAQVSALRIFRLLGSQVENKTLQKYLTNIAEDLQGGTPISTALSKYPDVFSDFYVNMVRAGEESGKLDQTFVYLADYLDRTYEITSKAKNALVYPAFVISTFIAVMVLMLTFIIPKIGAMIVDSGQPIPFYTQIVLSLSNLFIHYGLWMAVALALSIFFVVRYFRTEEGKKYYSHLQISTPYVGTLFRKLYLSRLADNMNTMILSGIPMLRSLEITSAVIDNDAFKNVLDKSLSAVKGGASLSNAFAQFPDEIPSIMVQMIKVGEETGELGHILKTLSTFYQREVIRAVDTLVSLIEPVMIVALGVGVGILLTSVLMPIYNIASAG